MKPNSELDERNGDLYDPEKEDGLSPVQRRDTASTRCGKLLLPSLLRIALICFVAWLLFFSLRYMGARAPCTEDRCSISTALNASTTGMLTDALTAEADEISYVSPAQSLPLSEEPTKATVSARITSEKRKLQKTTYSLKDEDDPSFLPHLPFGKNKRYRRVCAPVHSSILCMTLRFPIEVAPQDPRYIYPKPVDERFYDFKKQAVFIDGKDLLACRHNITGPMDKVVQTCLDNFAANAKDSNITVFGIWTRRRLIGDDNNKEMALYGVHMANYQKRRVDQYFHNHVVLVVGASPAPAVLDCMGAMFGSCGFGGIKPKSFACSGHGDLPEDEFDISPGKDGKNGERRLGNSRSFQQLPEDKMFITTKRWAPTDISKGRYHSLPEQNFTEFLLSENFARDPGYKDLRKLSLIVEYPLAHVQNQDAIFGEWESVEAIQKGLPKLFMNAYSEQGQEDLFKLGYELEHFIAFDGLPQFNPTESGAYNFEQFRCKHEEELSTCLTKWIPDYGTKCRGPLTPVSKLKATNQVAREAFQDLGMDMRFYGRIWEFANQFWWQVNMWGARGGLDCTHSNGGSGISCVHKYFLMTMIDDHFENKMMT